MNDENPVFEEEFLIEKTGLLFAWSKEIHGVSCECYTDLETGVRVYKIDNTCFLEQRGATAYSGK
jgi:hypothetical protein